MEYRQFCRRAMPGLAATVVIFTMGQALTPTYAQPETTSAAALGEVNSKSREPTPVHVPGAQPAVITGPLINNGGPVQTSPVIYVVYLGWTPPPPGEQNYFNNFLSTPGRTAWLYTHTPNPHSRH